MMKKITMLAGLMLLAGCATVPDHAREPPALPQPVVKEQPRQVNGAIFQAGRDQRLFENRTALRPGDLITIILEEETGASKQASTNVSKSSDTNIGTPQVFGRDVTVRGNPLSASASADRDFNGSGNVNQQNELTGVLTAIVVDVHPSGILVVQGQKKLTINHGDEYITLTGLVRPDDVRPDNTVSSTRVANAQVAYTGTGTLADSNRMGWMQRIFNSPLWPF
ncbi:flagellar L-ring protein precursor FlgH [Natronocella acetinitrilica]|jgi:flagellar L-ring protein FlgH|uniref:Flagellar L-ring protein n=1 Tax=Natronocella acetinitrilica TaxID=414046 RepID=A0AAE3KCY6_9GAMM|nr:flagellar basal body L-ring protein FlgH [Natronocella acetinitrilica]MCP1675618.1 flagellar L-ring protein precursor FlgH [Natronocella acetinitrilica]